MQPKSPLVKHATGTGALTAAVTGGSSSRKGWWHHGVLRQRQTNMRERIGRQGWGCWRFWGNVTPCV